MTCVVVEEAEAHEHEIAHGRRDAGGTLRRDELFDEQRIAFGVPRDPFRIRRPGVRAEQLRRHLRRVCPTEAREVDALASESAELCDEISLDETSSGRYAATSRIGSRGRFVAT